MTAQPQRVEDLETPALVIDLDIMERNLQRIADYTSEYELRLRPHTKTHKIPALGRKQVELGAVGLTVAKVGEAEVMVKAEPPEILVAYPVIGHSKLERLMEVAKKTRVTVSLDSEVAARQLSDAAQAAQTEVGVLAEVDVGLGRVGVAPGDSLLTLAKQIASLPGLHFEGVAFYPGHIKGVGAEGQVALEHLTQTVQFIIDSLSGIGLKPKVVSGGSTPTLFSSHLVEGVNEIRPGTYIFNDRNSVSAGLCGYEHCAASMLMTVVSTSKPGQMIVDGGSKTFSSDRLITGGDTTFGYVVDAPEALFTKMNEEHGYVELGKTDRKFEVGDRVRIIPNHVCTAVNMHERLYGVRNGTVEEIWTVEGRGKLQ